MSKKNLKGVFAACTVLLVALMAGPFAAHGQDHCHAPNVEADSPGQGKKSAAHSSDVQYVCPMHPEVVSQTKGSCPRCGMHLRERAADAAPAAQTASHAAPAHASHTGMNIPDVELLDQEGRTVRFYTDLVKGRTVAINFIFTTCTTICPPLGATFARLQRDLGERAGRDVHFISISVDPVTDTPERLKAWGAKFQAGPSWTFVTGAKPQVDELLRALAASTSTPADHTPTVLIGNEAKGQWTRAYGLAKPSQLVEIINRAQHGALEEPGR